MDTAQIAALLQPFLEQPLTLSQLDQISTYIDLLRRWNARINLTAIRKDEEIVTRHFGESFFLARHLFPTRTAGAPPKLCLGGDVRNSSGNWQPATGNWVLGTGYCPLRVLDIGSGAGFPALPLKLWAPHIHLTLIESNHKKAAFLREVARALTLTDINVIAARAETLSADPAFPKANFVTLRAVERFHKILPHAASFLAPNGTLALLISSAYLPHLSTQTTIKWTLPIPIPQSHSRVLLVGCRP
ncbi:MAG: 16S rRNA (guanine(527)-N(7))-methyltransferase RsmG [Terriglobales bacterium]|jgi:16S rRNA (guanine527-N7)-methyltransferase